MSLRIGICDDEVVWQEKVTAMLKTYGEQQKMDLQVSCFGDAESLVMYAGAALHILFMDIDLNGDNGIDLAGKVNLRWPGCQIIYLTKYISRAMDVYRTQHIYFVVKDQFKERFQDVMEKAKDQLRLRKQKIIVAAHGRQQLIFEPEELLYFEREKRITRIVSIRGEFITNEKIDSLVERLPGIDFVRCHNSYIVYLPAVEKYEKNTFQMKDGKKIMVSRGYSAQTKIAFERWVRLQSG